MACGQSFQASGRIAFGAAMSCLHPRKIVCQDERHIQHLWHCQKCDCHFEVISPTDTTALEAIMEKNRSSCAASQSSRIALSRIE